MWWDGEGLFVVSVNFLQFDKTTTKTGVDEIRRNGTRLKQEAGTTVGEWLYFAGRAAGRFAFQLLIHASWIALSIRYVTNKLEKLGFSVSESGSYPQRIRGAWGGEMVVGRS
jgi:hypothetical protein